MNTLKEKIAILEAMEKGLTIQYSDTDGETDEWWDLETSELDFAMYTYRVKPNSNPDARFKIGDKVVHIADEGKLRPFVSTIKGFTSNGEYLLGEVGNRSPVEAIDANYINVKDAYWFHLVYDEESDKYSLTAGMYKTSELKPCAKEEYIPMFEMGFRIPRKD